MADKYVEARQEILTKLALGVNNLAEAAKEEGVVYDDSPDLKYFCMVFEVVLRHGLKASTGLFGKKRDYWNLITLLPGMYAEASGIIDTVQNMSEVTTAVGRGRAWIRMALMEKKLAEFVMVLSSMSDTVTEWYHPEAIMRTRDDRSQMLTVLAELNILDFNFCARDMNLDESWDPVRRSARPVPAVPATPTAATPVAAAADGGSAQKYPEVLGARGSSRVDKIESVTPEHSDDVVWEVKKKKKKVKKKSSLSFAPGEFDSTAASLSSDATNLRGEEVDELERRLNEETAARAAERATADQARQSEERLKAQIADLQARVAAMVPAEDVERLRRTIAEEGEQHAAAAASLTKAKDAAVVASERTTAEAADQRARLEREKKELAETADSCRVERDMLQGLVDKLQKNLPQADRDTVSLMASFNVERQEMRRAAQRELAEVQEASDGAVTALTKEYSEKFASLLSERDAARHERDDARGSIEKLTVKLEAAQKDASSTAVRIQEASAEREKARVGWDAEMAALRALHESDRKRLVGLELVLGEAREAATAASRRAEVVMEEKVAAAVEAERARLKKESDAAVAALEQRCSTAEREREDALRALERERADHLPSLEAMRAEFAKERAALQAGFEEDKEEMKRVVAQLSTDVGRSEEATLAQSAGLRTELERANKAEAEARAEAEEARRKSDVFAAAAAAAEAKAATAEKERGVLATRLEAEEDKGSAALAAATRSSAALLKERDTARAAEDEALKLRAEAESRAALLTVELEALRKQVASGGSKTDAASPTTDAAVVAELRASLTARSAEVESLKREMQTMRGLAEKASAEAAVQSAVLRAELERVNQTLASRTALASPRARADSAAQLQASSEDSPTIKSDAAPDVAMAKLKEASTRITRLTAEVSQAKNAAEQAKAAAEVSRQQAEAAKAVVTGMEIAIAERDDELTRLRNDVKQARQSLEQRLSLSQSLDTLRSDHDERGREVARLTAELRDARQREAAMQASAQAEGASASTELLGLRSELSSLKESASRAQREFNAQLIEKNQALVARAEEMVAYREQTARSVEELVQDLARAKENIALLGNERSQAASRVAEERNNLSRLHATELERVKTDHAYALRTAEVTLDEERRACAALRQEVEQSRAHAASGATARDDVSRALAEQQALVASLRGEAEAGKAEMAQARVAWQAKERELRERIAATEEMAMKLKGDMERVARDASEVEDALFEREKADRDHEGWIKNEEAKECPSCSKNFSLLRRRHHCRNCGGIYCDECSSQRLQLASSKAPVRICDDCYKLVINKRNARSSISSRRGGRGGGPAGLHPASTVM